MPGYPKQTIKGSHRRSHEPTQKPCSDVNSCRSLGLALSANIHANGPSLRKGQSMWSLLDISEDSDL